MRTPKVGDTVDIPSRKLTGTLTDFIEAILAGEVETAIVRLADNEYWRGPGSEIVIKRPKIEKPPLGSVYRHHDGRFAVDVLYGPCKGMWLYYEWYVYSSKPYEKPIKPDRGTLCTWEGLLDQTDGLAGFFLFSPETNFKEELP